MRLRPYFSVILAIFASTLASGATLLIQGGDAKTSVAGDAVQRLSEPRGELSSVRAALTIDWDGGIATLIDSGACTDAKLLLRLSIAPSFRSGTKVVALLDGIDGEFSVSSGGYAWQVTQFNFGTEVGRATYESQSGQMALLLPVLLRPTNLATPGPMHRVLMLDCTISGDAVHCSRAAFGREPLVARSFPGEPGLANEVWELLGAPRLSPSSGPGHE